MSGGTFMVARSIWDHPEFAAEDFTEREAWLWLIGEAAWKPRRKRFGRAVVDLERGQLVASVRFMAEAWGWSKSRVSRFLERLKKRDMLMTKPGTLAMVVTICNYDEFQIGGEDAGTLAGHEAGHERDTAGTNEKKGKKGNKGKEGGDTPPPAPRKRGTRLPDDWSLPLSWGQWAVTDEGFDEPTVRREAAQFRDYWIAKSGAGATKLDWLATWRGWMRRIPQHKRKEQRHVAQPHAPRGAAARTANAQEYVLNFFSGNGDGVGGANAFAPEHEGPHGGDRGGPFAAAGDDAGRARGHDHGWH